VPRLQNSCPVESPDRQSLKLSRRYLLASMANTDPVFPIGTATGLPVSRRNMLGSPVAAVAVNHPPANAGFSRFEDGWSALPTNQPRSDRWFMSHRSCSTRIAKSSAAGTFTGPAGAVIVSPDSASAAPGYVTLTACRAIVTLAVRAAVDAFACADTETLPLPVPPPPTVIHAELEADVQTQPEPAVTLTVAVPPDCGRLTPELSMA
jgi:hypothetical protein